MNTKEYLSIKQASLFASAYLQKEVTPSNISYLIQYGKIKKHSKNGSTIVDKQNLLDYYKKYNRKREDNWQEKLGKDLNWALSFEHVKEKDTTKHVHRLHPYKGKFIPQLVEYFMDSHIDTHKKEAYFQKEDIILDPFCGSGTTMVQANELGMHAIGVDISSFNTLISNAKVTKVNFEDLNYSIENITHALEKCITKNKNVQFDNELLQVLSVFNKKHFPSPEYKIKVYQNKIDEKSYGQEKEIEFVTLFQNIQKKHNLKIQQTGSSTFIEKWYLAPIRKEIDTMYEELQNITDPITKNIITIIISRTLRSCRATTHADLATLKEPVTKPYYCAKHGKICKPLFSTLSWWKRYSKDTKNRLLDFNSLRTNTFQTCIQGDARNIDVLAELSKINSEFQALVQKKKIRGVFSSPPYIGLIDYHEQHAYAYDLFGFTRNDEYEIGSLRKGQSKEARNSYIEGIVQVLNNTKQFLQKNYDVFLVANDKYNMYPTIAQKSGMEIFNQYTRPVLNRTEKDKSAYAEIIFHLKEK